MVTQIKCGIKAKRHGRSVLRNSLTTRSAVGAKIPRPSVSGFLPPHWTSWWVNCAIPTAHVVSLYNMCSMYSVIIIHSKFNLREVIDISAHRLRTPSEALWYGFVAIDDTTPKLNLNSRRISFVNYTHPLKQTGKLQFCTWRGVDMTMNKITFHRVKYHYSRATVAIAGSRNSL